MNNGYAFDVVVVGAGPAGLGAARTAARLGFSTLVIERLAGPGELGHPCSAMIAPVPHTCSRQEGGLHFRKIDLTIPALLVKGFPAQQHWVGPGGQETTTALSGQGGSPAAAIDKPGLLRLLGGQAEAAGAVLRYGSAATGLLGRTGRVAGVICDGREGIKAGVVLAAEGSARGLAAWPCPAPAGWPPAARSSSSARNSKRRRPARNKSGKPSLSASAMGLGQGGVPSGWPWLRRRAGWRCSCLSSEASRTAAQRALQENTCSTTCVRTRAWASCAPGRAHCKGPRQRSPAWP